MISRDFLALTFSSLQRNRMRGGLTMLGIVIGVAAVIVMVGIGAGSREASINVIRSLGTNIIMIFPGSSARLGTGPVGLGAVATLTEEDADALRSQLPGLLTAATPAMRTSRPAVYQNANWLVGMVMGVNADYPLINPWPLERGRYFTEQEVRLQAKVCLLGKTVQENLFLPGEDAVGKTIRIGRMPFEVIGILSRKGGGPMGDMDDSIQAPYTTVMRKIMGRNRLQSIAVSVASEARMSEADSEITALLRQRHHLRPGDDNDFTLRRQDDFIAMASQHSEIIAALLTLAAAISLIVGGVGISNIMLAAVTERTHEIGLRRAVGATRTSVLGQFLLEAAVLAGTGGGFGIVLAWAVLRALQAFAVPALVVGWGVTLGAGCSLLVGLLAGFLPAWKASRLKVVDAMRYE